MDLPVSCVIYLELVANDYLLLKYIKCQYADIRGIIMRITVFTPTFNRAYIIEKLYQSLKIQKFTDFEWLVIDDGSVDNTNELFDQWIKEENRFRIRYYRYENSGKPKEINRALDLARGELFLTVDSDDVLTDNALELIDFWEKTLPHDGTYCAFAGSDGDMQRMPTNPIFNEPWVDADFFDRDPGSPRFIGYDRPWVFYTDIHKKYRYPEFSDEKFITEAVVWNRMAHDGYKIRCFDEVIYLFEHQEDGYTNNIESVFLKNPKGYGLWQQEWMEFCKYTLKQKCKGYYSFCCDFGSRYSLKQLCNYIGAPRLLFGLIWTMWKLKVR